jgi:hypothetical protein
MRLIPEFFNAIEQGYRCSQCHTIWAIYGEKGCECKDVPCSPDRIVEDDELTMGWTCLYCGAQWPVMKLRSCNCLCPYSYGEIKNNKMGVI